MEFAVNKKEDLRVIPADSESHSCADLYNYSCVCFAHPSVTLQQWNILFSDMNAWSSICPGKYHGLMDSRKRKLMITSTVQPKACGLFCLRHWKQSRIVIAGMIRPSWLIMRNSDMRGVVVTKRRMLFGCRLLPYLLVISQLRPDILPANSSIEGAKDNQSNIVCSKFGHLASCMPTCMWIQSCWIQHFDMWTGMLEVLKGNASLKSLCILQLEGNVGRKWCSRLFCEVTISLGYCFSVRRDTMLEGCLDVLPVNAWM